MEEAQNVVVIEETKQKPAESNTSVPQNPLNANIISAGNQDLEHL